MCFLPLLPPQVMPVNGISWSEEAVEWFHKMVHDRTLYARLFPRGCEVTVELFLERGKIGSMRCITTECKVLICLVVVEFYGDIKEWYHVVSSDCTCLNIGDCISGGVHRCL